MANAGYRPSKNQPVTAWAIHLDQVMRDRDWSRVRLFEEVGEALGYGIKSRSAMLPLLADKEPNADQAAILTRYFGEPTPKESPAGDTPAGDSLAEAIRELTRELAANREERERYDARLRALESELESLRGSPVAAAS